MEKVKKFMADLFLLESLMEKQREPLIVKLVRTILVSGVTSLVTAHIALWLLK